jgi:HPt (histidine-containing phosphotransfer) domain-containing protein
MDAYLAKPLDSRLLSQMLAELAGGLPAVSSIEPSPAPVIEDFILDRKASLARVGGDVELLGELIDLFQSDSPGWLEDVRRAVLAGDPAKLRRAAHTLKGAAGSFGAKETCDAAFHLEEMGRTAQLAGAEVALAELDNAFTRLRAALPALRAHEST